MVKHMEDSRSRKKELAGNTLILSIGRICTQGINFFLLPLYTALLQPEEYGIVDLFNTYITLLIPIVSWAIDQGLFRFMLDKRDNMGEQKQLFSSIIVLNLLQCAGYLVLYLVIQPYISSPYKVFLAIDVILNVFLNTMLQFARGLGHNGSYSLASFLSAGFLVVLNVIFIAGLKMGVLGMFMATVLAKATSLIYLLISQKGWRFFSFEGVHKEALKEVVRYSLPLIPAQLSWWVISASDRTIVSYFLGIGQNGIYSVAAKFSTIYITVFNIFILAWTEFVSVHINDSDKDELFSNIFKTVFSLFSAAALGIIAVMPIAYPLLTDAQYASGYTQVPILMIAALFQMLCGIYNTVYIAIKKSKESAKTSLFAAIINVLVDLALIKIIGLYAASLSTLVAFATMALYRFYDSQKYLKMKIDKKLVIFTFIVAVIDCAIVVYNHTITTVLNILFVIAYAFIVNKAVLTQIREGVLKMLKLKRKRGT